MRFSLFLVCFFTLGCLVAQTNFLPKKYLLFELNGSYATSTELLDGSNNVQSKSFYIGPKAAIGFALGNNRYFYGSLGYDFRQDTTTLLNGTDQEKLRLSSPVVGIGFKRFFQFGNTPFYFNYDLGLYYHMGMLSGKRYIEEYDNWGQVEIQNLSSEGQAALVELGITPGFTAFFNESFFAELSFGFLGLSYSNSNLVYSNGNDMEDKSTDVKIDLSPTTIRLRLGYFF